MSITIHDIDIAALNYQFAGKTLMTHDLSASADETVLIELERLFNPDFIFSNETPFSSNRNLKLSNRVLSILDNNQSPIARFNGGITSTAATIGRNSAARILVNPNGNNNEISIVDNAGTSIAKFNDYESSLGSVNTMLATVNNVYGIFEVAAVGYGSVFLLNPQGDTYAKLGDADGNRGDYSNCITAGNYGIAMQNTGTGSGALFVFDNYFGTHEYRLTPNDGWLPSLEFSSTPTNPNDIYSWGKFYNPNLGDYMFIPLYL